MIKAGTKIICPNSQCKSHIANLRIDLEWGMALSETLFEGVDQTISFAERTICKKCGESYYMHGSLHTENGWQS